jgi:transcriptional regulator with XRE-family HTH domain
MRMSFEVNGQRLRQLRIERALFLRALAQRSGVAFDTINKLELGPGPLDS